MKHRKDQKDQKDQKERALPMKSRLQIAGHPIHTMVVGLPIGLYTLAFVCDVAFMMLSDSFWFRMAFWTLVFGVVFHLVAAMTGIPDYLAVIRMKTDARRVAHSHLIFGITLLVIQGLNLGVRNGGVLPIDGSITFPFMVNLIAVAVLSLQGWYGGELVYRHKIGIDE